MSGALAAIELLTVLLDAATRTANAIAKARAEGREITSEELAQIRAETDTKQASLLAKLKAAAGQPQEN